MKYLNLSSLFVLFVLLSSCYSTDVFLRGSKVEQLPHSEQNIETDTISITKFKKERTTLIKTFISPSQEVFHPTEQSTTSFLENREPIISQKSANNQTVQTSSKTTNNHSVKPKIKHQPNHYLHHATASKNLKPQSKGIFGAVGHSFGVVGLVFLLVGVVLFLIGGLIIDTLGALFIAFGFLFLLIWLVLAVLQGLFDVIL